MEQNGGHQQMHPGNKKKVTNQANTGKVVLQSGRLWRVHFYFNVFKGSKDQISYHFECILTDGVLPISPSMSTLMKMILKI